MFRIPRLVGADLQEVIASRGEALQLPKNVSTAPFGVGDQPGGDLLPLSFKGVFLGTPPAQDPFSPLLLLVQGMEPCCRIGDAPLNGKLSCCTPFYRKDANRNRRNV